MHVDTDDWLKGLAKERGLSLRALALKVHRISKDKRDCETIANKIRDLNKRKDLGWWRQGKGRGLLPALAEALDLDLDQLLEQIQAHAVPGATGVGYWPFAMFPRLRPLDLRGERPFPGVPPDLVKTGGPRGQRTWWVAPVGAGKTLVGQWLQLQGWSYIAATSWKNVPEPLEGPAFIELESTVGLGIELLEALPTGVCIASPMLPPTTAEPRRASGEASPPGFPNAWVVLSTPLSQEWWSDLLSWVDRRVEPGGGFDQAKARTILEAWHMWFATPGEMLGFLGMIEQVGVEPLLRSSPTGAGLPRLIKEWFKAVLSRQDRQCPPGVADLLKQRGADILVQMEMQRRRKDFGDALPQAAWAELVPRQHAPDVDRDRLLSALDAGGAAAARQVLVPDAASVIAGLEAVRALTPARDGNYVMGPVWASALVRHLAIQRLASDVPDGLGTLLLKADTAAAGLRELFQDVNERRFDRVQRCLAEPPTSPERMAAVDAAFRALGFASAAGVELPLDMVRLAWERQMSHLVQRYVNWPPVPVVSVAAGPSDARGDTHIGAWFFAAFHLSHALVEHGVQVAASALNPWRGPLTDPNERHLCGSVLYAVALALTPRRPKDQPDAFPRASLVYKLGRCLLDRCGVLPEALVDAQGPAVLFMLAQGKLETQVLPHDLESILWLPWGLSAVEDACHGSDFPLAQVMQWTWRHWLENPRLDPLVWLRNTAAPWRRDDAKRLWAFAPVRDMPSNLIRLLGDSPEAWPVLPEAFWGRWLEWWGGKEHRHNDGEGAFEALPESLALQAVRDGTVDPYCHQARSILWRRMPSSLLALIDELAVSPPKPHSRIPDHGGPVCDLVFSVPDTHRPAVVERARAWLVEPSKYPGIGAWLRTWLARTIEERGKGWRAAYDVLMGALSNRA